MLNLNRSAALSLEQLDAYDRDGVLFPIEVLSRDEVQRFRLEIETVCAKLGGALKRIDQCHLFFSWACELALKPAVLDVVESLVGPEILLHSTRLFYKHPKDPAYVSWHLDGRYSGLNSYQAPTVWIALTESNRQNGGLRIVRSSHRFAPASFVEKPHADNLENHGQEVDVDSTRADIVDVSLQPGEMSVHDVNVIHGSEANSSDISRIGFSISYVTPKVPTSILPLVRARGTEPCDHLRLVMAPEPCRLEHSIAAHAAFLQANSLQAPRLG